MEGQQWTKLLVLLDQNSSEYEHLSINEAFLKFYNETNNIPHEEWLSEQLAETPTKSNTKAETFRSLGNKFYCRGNFKESIKWYTMSLHFAIHNGAEYGKALANRSAASFALEQYDECLKDIGACFASEYPVELQQKVLLRKLQAYYHLDMDDEFNKQVLDMEDEFKDTEIFQQCINNYKNKDRTGEGKKSPAKLDPENLLLMNETFAFATDLVELRYNSEKGRHVIAAKDIEPNSILFKEEAFVAAQIFKSREELEHEVCYNCLKHIPYFSLPCPSCTYCLYCSENCKTTSWSSSHRFECPGMIIFYELGQALPAFKCIMKGITSNYTEADKTSVIFGDSDNNYKYANSLLTNFEIRSDKMNFLGVALIIIIYLRNKTDFFTYIREYIQNREDLEVFIGQMLVKHMVQLFCNGSIVERQTGVNSERRPIAAAIYPSICMMNHSCKSNITIKYNGSTAIVKSIDKILEGEEVFNSYGVDYTTDKSFRRKYLLENFGFHCSCSICVNN